MPQDSLFGRFAKRVSSITGKPATFLTMLSLVIVWAVSGPLFGFSETWQLVINTGTTIITFLMVFIIQHTQNKDTAAMQIKLDELIRVNSKAHNVTMALEDIREDEIEAIQSRYQQLGNDAVEHLRSGTKDDAKPEADETFGIGDLGRKAKDKPKKTTKKKKA